MTLKTTATALTAVCAAVLMSACQGHSTAASPGSTSSSSSARTSRPGVAAVASSTLPASTVPASKPAGDAPASMPPAATTSAAQTTTAVKGAVPDPCNLVKAADIQSVVGLPVDAPRSSDAGISRLCSYAHSDTDEDNTFAVGVTVVHDPENRSDFELGRQVLPSASAVPGVGDDAYWNPDMQTIYVLKGGLVFEVVLGGANEKIADTDAQANATALARIAVTRI